MDWKAQFDQKKMTLDEIAGTIRSGDKITVGPLSGFPLELVNAVTNRGDLSDILFYSGLLLTLPDFVKEEYEIGRASCRERV